MIFVDNSVPVPVDDRPRPESDPEVLRAALRRMPARAPYRWVGGRGGMLRCFYCEHGPREPHAEDCDWKLGRRLIFP